MSSTLRCDFCDQPLMMGHTCPVQPMGDIPKPADKINPAHYKTGPKCDCGRVIECIQITRHMNFNIGNAIKYLWRLGHKDDPIQELEKVEWYVKDEITRRKNGSNK